MNMDAQMTADLVAIMTPVTKYSTMALDHRSLLRTLRRAIKIAATPPMGPVYVCLPGDILDRDNDEPVFPSSIPSTRSCAEQSIIDKAADILLIADRPMIYVGDGVAYSGAIEELTRVAELLGAQVYGCDTGDLDMNTTHPLYMGVTGHMFGSHSLPILKQGDVNLIVGTYMVPEVYPDLGDIFQEKATIIHFDLNSYEIAKNPRVDLGIVCDPKLSLAALAEAIEEKIDQDRRERSKKLIQKNAEAKRNQREEEIRKDEAWKNKTPLHMSQFAKALAEKLPDDAVIFDEALTSSPDLARYIQPRRPGSYFVTRGGSLGVGIPGALGLKLANPDKTVIGFSGDGGSMYTIQALWSAARHNTGAKFVICNNGCYRLLQLNINAYWDEIGIAPHDYPVCFDLSWPRIDFSSLAKSLSVDAVKVEKPEEIEPAIELMLADDSPFLVDLLLEGEVRPEMVGIKCGQ